MTLSHRLPAHFHQLVDSGRAIPMLADYRPAELPNHSLTVIGLIDTVGFESAFVGDDEVMTEMVRLKLPEGSLEHVSKIQTDSADALAIHELWSRWNGGVRDRYIQFTKTVATVLSMAGLNTALQEATFVGDDRQKRSSKPKKPRSRSTASSQRRPGSATKNKGSGRVVK